MIRTHILPCALPSHVADALNQASGAIYTQVLVSHWRILRHQRHWLSEQAGTRWSDSRLPVKPLHAHSIDAAQLMRRRRDTGQSQDCSLETVHV